MACIDFGRHSEDKGRTYFAGDAARLELCKELARRCVWTTMNQLPDDATTMVLAQVVFPSLVDYREYICEQPLPGYPPSRILAALLEENDLEGACAYLSVIESSMPESYPLDDNSLEPLNELVLQASAYFTTELEKLSEDELLSSTWRVSLISVIKSLIPIQEATHGKSFDAILSATIARAAYKKGDLDLFDAMISHERFDLPNPSAFTISLEDIWLPAKAGRIELQQRLIENLQQDLEKLGQVSKNKAILQFWGGVPAFFSVLQIHDDAKAWAVLLSQGIGPFNYDSLFNGKNLLLTKQLYPMFLNIAMLGKYAKEAGVDVPIEALRNILMPLERSAAISGRAWVPYMGADYKDMELALSLLFRDVAPSDLSKRPLPKHLASTLSDLLGDTKWIGKASRRDRGRILSDDLGL
jgi:hypothetical protein